MAFVTVQALITNDVALTTVPTLRIPRSLAPVAPTDILVKKMTELAVTAVVLTVTVPPERVAVPIEAFAPAAISNLFPAVPKTTFPLEAKMFPVVVVKPVPAVMVVPADIDPAVALIFPADATILPVVAVMPVPAVTVVPALTDVPADTAPAVAVIFPVVAVTPVPAVTVVAADIDPRVALIFPAEATMFPVVAVMPVPAVTVVVAASDVVAVAEPGNVTADGKDHVRVFVPPVVVIWLEVPDIVTAPAAVGTTGLVPASGTNESMATPPPESAIVTVEPDAEVVTPVPPAMRIFPDDGVAVPVSPVRVERVPLAPPSIAHVAETTPAEAVRLQRV